MNVVWNIVRKDFFRLRWIIALWAVVLTAGVMLATIQMGLDETTYLPFLVGAIMLASGVTPLIGFGLVMGLLHDDPVADTDAFWITRPISNRQLLLAKSFALALLSLVPVVCLLPWWLVNDYGASQLATALRLTLLQQAIMAALAVPLAAVSPNGSKFVMNVLLGIGAFFVLALLHGLGDGHRSASVSPALVHPRTVALITLWLGATAIVVRNQFFGRRTRRSWIVLATAAVVGFAISKLWTWEVRDPALGSKSPESSQTAPLAWQVESAAFAPADPASAAREKPIRVAYRATGLAANAVAVVGTVKHRLQWPNDVIEAYSPIAADQLPHAALAVALGKRVDSSLHAEFPVTKPYGERLVGESPAFTADLDGGIRSLELVAEAPLRTGRKSVRDGVILRVGEFLTDPMTGILSVAVGEAVVQSALDLPIEVVGRSNQPESTAYYFLLDRMDGRALPAEVGRFGMPPQIATLRYTHLNLKFPLRSKNWEGGPPSDFRTFLERAVLVKVVAHPAGEFHRAVSVAAFKPTPPVAAEVRAPGEKQP